PYENVKKGMNYPSVLFYTTGSDDRVGPEQARKMAAKMRHMGYENVWFYENRGGGHGAGADAKHSATMFAMDYNFRWIKLTYGRSLGLASYWRMSRGDAPLMRERAMPRWSAPMPGVTGGCANATHLRPGRPPVSALLRRFRW